MMTEETEGSNGDNHEGKTIQMKAGKKMWGVIRALDLQVTAVVVQRNTKKKDKGAEF